MPKNYFNAKINFRFNYDEEDDEKIGKVSIIREQHTI